MTAQYSGVTGTIYDAYFQYGTSRGNLNQTAYLSSNMPTGASGSFSCTAYSLHPNTTYYYRAVMQVDDEDIMGEIRSFTTGSTTPTPGPGPRYLEMPLPVSGSDYFSETLKISGERNYSYLYDLTKYAALWVAYPLTATHISGSASSSWSFNPNISQQYQVHITGSSYPSNYNNATKYARGHQIPNADRKCNSEMNRQTYYATNQTPQLQDKFNGSIWENLESAVRGLTSSTDTIYVVTGACFQTVGGSETIHYLSSKGSATPQQVPIPNYYWKVLLKVRRSGSTITAASTVGIWMEHKEYDNQDWSGCVVSVDEIENLTGFDFFHNLPSSIGASAETNSNWNTFRNF